MGRQGLTLRVAGLAALPAPARKPRLFETAVRKTFARERARAKGEVSVVITTRTKMRALNLEFLGRDDDTDVISFAHDPVPGLPAAEQALGDIYISSWMAARQAKELGHGVLREILTLVVHGALHILGYHDAAPRDRARMFRRQDEIMASLPR
ncbi:MAG TPA: rRNA maturation RNase YbeY [Elusimicrobia bacterium]|nr:MAG: rRNA maturation RNase YbeY [Elusimicrobia bacterium GWA2_66_18]OGR71779.1 MAG: rRNA maturation RNase YbeY [Elusimicrobia bacterium GWC2_65_9]HAZ07518.1 rRNA maturation RNase YbeY [Elusimicrobiota bacterium]